MRLPNKLYTYNESVIAKFPKILSILDKTPMSVSQLYREHMKDYVNIDEYIETLDSLYALRKIQYDDAEEVLRCADPDGK